MPITTSMPMMMPAIYPTPPRAPNAAPVAARLIVAGPGLPASASPARTKPSIVSIAAPPAASPMQRQPFERLIHELAVAAHGHAGEAQVLAAHRLHHSAVGGVVVRAEQVFGEDRELQPGMAQAVIGPPQLPRRRREHQHRLPEHRQITMPGAVLVDLADAVGLGAGHAAHQERGGVQLLPNR